MLAQIIKSILTLLVLSSTTAFLFTNDQTSFAKVFVLASLLQVIIYQVYMQAVKLFAEKLLNDRMVEYSKQGTDVVCPCARAVKHFIPIQLNTDNSYKCLDCSKNIAVNVDVKTFLETIPMDLDKSNAALDVVYDEITSKPQNGNNI